MGTHRWSRRIAPLLVAAMLTPLLGVAPAYAAGSFTGGPTDTVLFAPNDHTPIAFRFKATAGLAPSTDYYVKVRFTVGTSPNPSTNRGMTWNATTLTWVPDLGGGNWSDYPVVTSNPDGTITEQWIFAKFADEAASGTRHIMISLYDIEGNSTYNGSVVPTVTVMPMASAGAWVHNGTNVTSTYWGKRSECTSDTSSDAIYALGKTEPDLIDSDSNGTVDDEDYGPAGAGGDFRHAVPLSMPFNMLLSRTTTYASSQQITIADTDIALNAADQIAPTAPSSLSVVPNVGENALTWGAATDAGGSGLAGYRVYRWQTITATEYTLPKLVIATTASDVTTYTDTDVVKGVEYFYEVRAVDASTNVGPRSQTDSGIPFGAAPVAEDDAYTVAEDSVLTTPTPGVLANDTDADLDPLTASKVTDPAHGTLTLNANGSFTYTPAADYNGPDSFTYRAYDGGQYSNIATVTLDVTPVDELETVEIAGDNRFTTAIEASKKAFKASEYVVIATGYNWPDALGGSALAGALDAPILLTRKDSLPSEVTAEIVRLGATKAIILGGTPAVSSSVASAIDAIPGVSVERIAGANRYETANKVAARTVAILEEGAGYDGTAFVATGANFPDALGASPLAAANGWPIYLANPALGSNASMVATMAVAGVTNPIVLGGTNVVGTPVEMELLSLGGLTRLSGANRYETAVEVATYGVVHAGLQWDMVAIATGQNFPDALAGGVLQGRYGSVLLLTPGTSLDAGVASTLTENKATIFEVRFLGSTMAVSQAVRDRVVDALK